jgi:hypothetical protein
MRRCKGIFATFLRPIYIFSGSLPAWNGSPSRRFQRHFCPFTECCSPASDMSISWPTPVINAQDSSRNATKEHVHEENYARARWLRGNPAILPVTREFSKTHFLSLMVIIEGATETLERQTRACKPLQRLRYYSMVTAAFQRSNFFWSRR